MVSSDCAELVAALEERTQRAPQDFPVSRTYRFEVHRAGATGYRIEEAGRPTEHRDDPGNAAEALFWRMHELSLEALPEYTKIHAGCADWRGRRFVIAGRARAGKTTLMTRMLFEGFQVHSDDIVLLREGEALPYPRRFWTRAESVALLPQIAPLLMRKHPVRDHFSLDPRELGFQWQITSAPVSAVLFLEPRHGGETRITPCPKYRMANLIMSQSLLPAAGARDWIRDVLGMLDISSCLLLECGSLDSAVKALKNTLELQSRLGDKADE